MSTAPLQLIPPPLQITSFMCVEVCAILPPAHQALLRSAGFVGVAVFEEVVMRSRSLIYAEYDDSSCPLDAVAVVNNYSEDNVDVETVIKDGVSDVGDSKHSTSITHHTTTDTTPPTLPLHYPIDRTCMQLQLTTIDMSTSQHHLPDVLVVSHAFLQQHKIPLALLYLHPIPCVRYTITPNEPPKPELQFTHVLPEISNIPGAASSLEFSGFECLRAVWDRFLANCVTLTSIDMGPLRNVTSVGDCFLYRCLSLSTIDLSSLCNVTAIGTHFLASCTSLKSVDFGGKTSSTKWKLEAIADRFMMHCHSLSSIDFSAFDNVKRIDNNFMFSCSALTKIDNLGSSFGKVNKVGQHFMYGCKSLATFDTNCFSNRTFTTIVALGDFFLSNCEGLTEVDLTPLLTLGNNSTTDTGGAVEMNNDEECDAGVTEIKIPSGLLYMCCVLSSVTLGSTPTSSSSSSSSLATIIPDYFIHGCTSLTSIDLTPLSNIKTIGNNCLSRNKRISSLDLSAFSNVTHIGNFFLTGCKSLTTLDLTPLGKVVSIGEFFLSECTSIAYLDFTPLHNVTTSIGSYFMMKCTSLKSIHLAPLNCVTGPVGTGCWLVGCGEELVIEDRDVLNNRLRMALMGL